MLQLLLQATSAPLEPAKTIQPSGPADQHPSWLQLLASDNTTNANAGDRFLSTDPRKLREIASFETGYNLELNMGAETYHAPHFTPWDFLNYNQHLWHPGEPRGASCANLVRYGNDGDGGKMVCDAEGVLQRQRECLIVSVGSNGDVSFETAMRSLAPHCAVHIYDPTLTPEKRARIPSWATFYNEPFNATTVLKPAYKGKSIAILKIDCEGCEFDALGPWSRHTCTDLIIPEVHGCAEDANAPKSPLERIVRTHTLMSTLEKNGYRVYSAEMNLLASEHTCVEYGLKRNTACSQ